MPETGYLRAASNKQEECMRRLGLWMAALLLLVCVPAGFAQGKKKADDRRSVQGVVSAADDTPVKGAVVQLKNTKTLQIRSFITQENGSYYFHELSPDVEFELTAEDQKAGT